MNDQQPFGKIKVSVPILDLGALQSSLRAQVEYFDGRFRLQKRAASGETVALAPGNYIYAITLPDGSRHTNSVEIRPEKTTTIELEWRPATSKAVISQIQTGAKAVPGVVAPTRYYLRFLKIEKGLQWTPDVEAPRKRTVEYSRERGVLFCSLIIEANKIGHFVYFAQVAADEADSVAIALPITDVGQASSCLMNLAVSAGRLDVNAEIRGSNEASVIAQLMESGQIFRAANPEVAEELLRGKLQHPFGAALGGYALLRANRLDLLHDWADNLAEWFSWLPDGHIIRGEKLLRHGQWAQAYQAFRRSLESGLPVFTDGLSILLSRLRTLARGTAYRGITDKTKRASQATLEEMSNILPWIDFDALFTTLRFRDVQISISKDWGWQQFSEPFGPADDYDDYWSEPKS